jgi:hypothetical protein
MGARHERAQLIGGPLSDLAALALFGQPLNQRFEVRRQGGEGALRSLTA